MSGPSSSSAPAGVPPSGTGKYILIALLLLVGIGGIAAYKFWPSSPPPPTVSSATPSASSSGPIAKRDDDEIPLPPPVVDSGPEAGPVKGNAPQIVTSGGGGGCEAKVCTGKAPPELSGALQVRAGQARRCYNTALSSDPSLKGRVTIAVRIGSNGAVCSAGVASNDMGTPVVASCAAGVFRSGAYPAPAGGCVDAAIPLNFVKQ